MGTITNPAARYIDEHEHTGLIIQKSNKPIKVNNRFMIDIKAAGFVID